MSKGWSEERRKKQAEAIRKHKPWEKSTGPRSDRGKAIASRNALKHGLYSAKSDIIRAILTKNQEFLALYVKYCDIYAFLETLERTEETFNEIKGQGPRPPENRGTN